MKDPFSPICEAFCKSWRHLLAALVLLIGSVTSLCVGLAWLALGVVVVIDGYVVLMVWSAAQLSAHKCTNGKSDPNAETWPGLPRRDGAILQLAILLAALVVAFATLYTPVGSLAPGSATRTLDALYFSVVTIATVGYGDLHPISDVAKITAIGQIASGVLFLAAAIPVLASRLADFD
jgi:hypothetical protein